MRPLERLWQLLPFCAAIVVFASAADSGWSNWDDPLYVLGRREVVEGTVDGLLKIWSMSDALNGRFIEYFPLRDSVYWCIHKLFGSAPEAYHWTNIIIHGFCAVFVGVLARRMKQSTLVATLAGVIFAVHPVHCESVVWIAALKDPMFLLFSLLSVISFIPDENGKRRYIASTFFLVAALLCKSLAIMVPCAMLLLEWRESTSIKTALGLVAGPALIVVLFTMNFIIIGKANNVIVDPLAGTWLLSALTSAWCGVMYVSKMCLPTQLYLYYIIEPIRSIGEPRSIAAIAIALFLVVGLIGLAQKDRTLAVLCAWFPVFLLPVSGLIPIPVFMADRYLYAPSVGYCLLVAIGLEYLILRRRALGIVLTITAVLGYAARTIVRNEDWRSTVALWTSVTEQPEAEGFDSPWIQLGEAYLGKDQYAEAEEALLKALAIQKKNRITAKRVGITNVYLGILYQEVGKLDLSRQHLRIALAVDATRPDTWNALSITEAGLGDPVAAEDAADHALRLDPGFASALYNRGLARLERGDLDNGVADIAAAVREPAICRKLKMWRSHVGESELSARVMAAAPACR